MSGANEEQCDCLAFARGDIVQMRLNPDIWGMVIDDRDFGSKCQIRLAGTLAIIELEAVELEHLPDDGLEGASKQQDNFTESNVIDLAKARAAGRG